MYEGHEGAGVGERRTSWSEGDAADWQRDEGGGGREHRARGVADGRRHA